MCKSFQMSTKPPDAPSNKMFILQGMASLCYVKWQLFIKCITYNTWYIYKWICPKCKKRNYKSLLTVIKALKTVFLLSHHQNHRPIPHQTNRQNLCDTNKSSSYTI